MGKVTDQIREQYYSIKKLNQEPCSVRLSAGKAFELIDEILDTMHIEIGKDELQKIAITRNETDLIEHFKNAIFMGMRVEVFKEVEVLNGC